MEYTGKLYGKIGNKYFDTGKTSSDFDEMLEMLKMFLLEFEYDNATQYQCELFYNSKQLIKKATELK